jgi:hypothetical protein
MNIAIYLHFCLNPPMGFEAHNIARKHVETKGVDAGFWFCDKLGKMHTLCAQGRRQQ